MTVVARWAFWWAVLAVVVVVDAPGPAAHFSPTACAAVSLAAGFAAFAVLARLRVRPLVPPRGELRSTALLGVHFTGRAAYEEALWRGLLLGPLSASFGAVAALIASTVAFAAAHVGLQGRRASAHLVTGATFGSVYLATGRLVAALVAHAAYDVLVALAAVADRTRPIRPIGTTRHASDDHATEARL